MEPFASCTFNSTLLQGAASILWLPVEERLAVLKSPSVMFLCPVEHLCVPTKCIIVVLTNGKIPRNMYI